MTESALPRIRVAIQLRWGDLDAFNHVNNVSMLKLLEEARIRAFFAGDGREEALPPTAILETRSGAGSVMLVARQEIEYLRPVLYQRAPLSVEMWIGHMGGSSLDLCYEVFTHADAPEAPAARAVSTLVVVSEGTGKPLRLDERQREVWGTYLGTPLALGRQR